MNTLYESSLAFTYLCQVVQHFLEESHLKICQNICFHNVATRQFFFFISWLTDPPTQIFAF